MTFPSPYDRLARLLAYYENAAETVRARLRALDRGRGERATARVLGVVTPGRATRAGRRRGRKTSGISTAVIKRRSHTAAVLAQFDPHEPKRATDVSIPMPGLGSLVRRGYLKPKSGGYIRTEKPFFVDPRGE